MSKDKGSKNKKKAPASASGKVKQMSTYKSEINKNIKNKSNGLDIQTDLIVKR